MNDTYVVKVAHKISKGGLSLEPGDTFTWKENDYPRFNGRIYPAKYVPKKWLLDINNLCEKC